MPAVSQAQQKLMGQAYALKKGELKPEDLNPDYREQIEDLAKGMTLKQLEDYAKTSLKELPKKVKEMKNIPTFEQFINESLNEAGDPAYWKQYDTGHTTSEPWMKEEAKTEAKVKDLVNRVIEFWDESSEDGATVTEKGREVITKQALEYLRKFRSVNGHVIDAMVMQTQYIEYK